MTLGSQLSCPLSKSLFLYLYLKWVTSLCKSSPFTSIAWDLTNCPWCRYVLLLFLLCLSRLCRAGRCRPRYSGIVATTKGTRAGLFRNLQSEPALIVDSCSLSFSFCLY